MIQHCKQELFPDRGLHVQGWALVEPEGYSFMENCRIDNECVIMQCREKSHLCVARLAHRRAFHLMLSAAACLPVAIEVTLNKCAASLEYRWKRLRKL